MSAREGERCFGVGWWSVIGIGADRTVWGVGRKGGDRGLREVTSRVEFLVDAVGVGIEG